jgi:hypothetical protein
VQEKALLVLQAAYDATAKVDESPSRVSVCLSVCLCHLLCSVEACFSGETRVRSTPTHVLCCADPPTPAPRIHALQTFAPDVNARVVAACSSDASLDGKNEKQVKQAVLPFAKFMMEAAVAEGPQVLDVKLPFDECAMLRTNLDYVKRALQLPSVTIALVTDATVAGAANPVDCSKAYPGNPVTSFTLEANPSPA